MTWRARPRFLSRIGVRLLAFNILLVFLPVAGLASLDAYEQHLLDQQERSMVQLGRLLWHTSNITSLLTGQMDDPRLLATYRRKRARFFAEPKVRALFGPVLPKA